jgi:nitrogen-specific signal transduction histidine kinase/ActR/RegA family two-component response regulator
MSVLSVNTDITEQKSFETQFLRAQRLESLGTLAGGIAHDLNNVLAPILLSFESLKRKMTDEKAIHMLSVAESSALRGKQIVSQVLTFARGFESAKGPLQLKSVLKEIEHIVKETFPRSIEVKSSIAAGLSMISGDITQIHQVLMNLCVNARDAMPRGGMLIISADNVDLDDAFASMRIGSHRGPYVLLEITDTGEGIPKENLERIFDPFFTTKGVGIGTGLGLSTVHTIVKGHGGFVDVASRPREGTTFRIYLPAMPGSPSDARAIESAELPRGNQELVLVVDDEMSIREITSQMLESFGYRCVTASDGVDGVSKLAVLKDKISVVIMDIMMPIMDGPSAIRAMRKMKPGLKFIVSSGNLSDERELVSEFGVAGFLPKPYTAGKLLTTLRSTLETQERNNEYPLPKAGDKVEGRPASFG